METGSAVVETSGEEVWMEAVFLRGDDRLSERGVFCLKAAAADDDEEEEEDEDEEEWRSVPVCLLECRKCRFLVWQAIRPRWAMGS